jgi:hypothetical protein
LKVNRAHRRAHTRSKKKTEQRKARWFEPDPQERKVRELNRLMRRELERAPDEDGEISGPLAVVARYVTPQLLKDFDLDETHTAPMEHWLLAKFGDVLRNPDVQGYLAWRESCLQTVQGA